MNKRGVTVLTLSIMVAVMAVLSMAAIPLGNNIHRGAQKSKFQAEIDQIEILTANYIRRNSGNDLEPYAWDISMLSGYGANQFEGEILTGNILDTYVVDLKKIDAEKVHYGLLEDGPTDRYLYSEQTGHVYYEKGKDFGDKIYFRVPELEE